MMAVLHHGEPCTFRSAKNIIFGNKKKMVSCPRFWTLEIINVLTINLSSLQELKFRVDQPGTGISCIYLFIMILYFMSVFSATCCNQKKEQCVCLCACDVVRCDVPLCLSYVVTCTPNFSSFLHSTFIPTNLLSAAAAK